MGEVLKFVTLRGGLRKKCKKNLRFLQKWLNFKTFFGLVSVWKPCFEQLKSEQNKHKKNWRVRAKLLDILSNDIMRKAKKMKLQCFSYSLQIICNLPSSKH